MSIQQPGGRLKRSTAQRLAWIVLILLAACGSLDEGERITGLAETGIAGTQQARALASLVASTLAQPTAAATPQPPAPTATTPPPGAQATGPESACPSAQPGRLLFIYAREGWCFLYPDDFTPRQPGPGKVDFLGPALVSGGETVRAYISIQKKEAVNDRTLDELMLDTWSASRSPFRSYNIVLGGRDALAAENLDLEDADFLVSQVLFLQNNQVYVISFSPLDDREPYVQVKQYVQEFWDTALASFVFYK